MVGESMSIAASLARRILIASALIPGTLGCSEKKPAGPPEAGSTGSTDAAGDASTGPETAIESGANDDVGSGAK